MNSNNSGNGGIARSAKPTFPMNPQPRSSNEGNQIILDRLMYNSMFDIVERQTAYTSHQHMTN